DAICLEGLLSGSMAARHRNVLRWTAAPSVCFRGKRIYGAPMEGRMCSWLAGLFLSRKTCADADRALGRSRVLCGGYFADSPSSLSVGCSCAALGLACCRGLFGVRSRNPPQTRRTNRLLVVGAGCRCALVRLHWFPSVSRKRHDVVGDPQDLPRF